MLDWKDREGSAVARLFLAAPALSAWLLAVEECFKRGGWSQEAWLKERALPDSIVSMGTNHSTLNKVELRGSY